MSGLTAPIFNGTVTQCQDVVVSWTGGEYPVRVEAFYQPDPVSDWKIAGLPSEAADSNVIRWQANVPAGTYAWITLVDHSGAYRQSPQGVLVQPSDDDSCLETSQTASVVTQTVFMSGDGQGSEAHLTNGLDDKALLILSICFGILAFAGLALAVLFYSRLRQMRRARKRGPRFSLAEDDYHNVFGRGGTAVDDDEVSRRGSMAAFIGPAALAAAGRNERRNEKGMNGASPNHHLEKGGMPSPNTSLGEHNPFLDPPLSTAGDTSPDSFNSYGEDHRRTHISVASDAGMQTLRSASITTAPSMPAGAFMSSRPAMRIRSSSRTETVHSATSMQLFDARAQGQLRVANDPSQIETPTLSREITRSSITSSSRYPTMNSEDAADLSLLPRSSRGSLRTDEGATGADLLGNGTFSNDGHSLMSARSGRTDATADHYTSEPHSSRGWLNASAHQTPK